MDHLLTQINDSQEVEIVCLTDNRCRTIGHKRNDLIYLAQGQYIVFIDDDDRVTDDYVSSILSEIDKSQEPDVVVFDVSVRDIDSTGPALSCKYGIEYTYYNDDKCYYRLPNHLMVYKREIAKKYLYLDISWREDDEWANRACKSVKSQARVPRVLYHYEYTYKKPQGPSPLNTKHGTVKSHANNIQANYGTNDYNVDVSTYVAENFVNEDKQLIIPAKIHLNHIFGDPVPNVHKRLEVSWACYRIVTEQDISDSENPIDLGKL
jgi:glycosyltransferase involved in cell wall biosynthesis